MTTWLRGVWLNLFWLHVLMAFGMLIAATAANAQSYPSKTITIIVPAAPGGVTDALGRVLAKHFSEAWGQQAVVENKPGANNQIAAEYIAKSSPDGYTLFIGPEVTFTVNPSLYPKLNYDPVKDFTPITGLVNTQTRSRYTRPITMAVDAGLI